MLMYFDSTEYSRSNYFFRFLSTFKYMYKEYFLVKEVPKIHRCSFTALISLVHRSLSKISMTFKRQTYLKNYFCDKECE